jgi:general nucleoside transport system permease protein
MKKIISNIFSNNAFSSFLASAIAIILGLLVGLIVMYVFNPAGAWPGFLTMLQGGFTDGARGIGQVLFYTTALIFAGLSVGFSFQTGLFNIGVIGQFTIAAYVAIIVGGKLTMPASIHWVVAMLAAGVAGLLWAAIPGILKAFFNVSEIITTIMMNYVALYLVNQLVYTTHLEVSTQMSKDIHPTALMPKVGFDTLFAGSSVNVGLFIALIFAIIVYIILFKTSYGYSLRCCGLNRDASHYAGIDEKRNILSVMLIAGFIAGIGGGILYLSALSKNFKIAEVFILEPGYGIPVALLGISNPIGIIFSSLFLAYIIIGGSLMQMYGFPVETVGMITSVIIYFAAFALIFKSLVNRIGLRLSTVGTQKIRTLKDE